MEQGTLHSSNGTARFKNVSNCLNTNIYSYLEVSDGQSSNLYLNVVHFVTLNHLHQSHMFAGKARNLPQSAVP